MGLWSRHVVPRLVDWACGLDGVTEMRARVVPRAAGRVLEVGFGTGHNLRWYDPARVERLIALEPAEEMLERARRRSAGARFPVEYLARAGEAIPLEAESVDTVVVTFTLCTIPEPLRALEGMRRVLRREGRLLFCEHGRAPEPGLERWQQRITPLWRRVSGGCHLDRDPTALLAKAGFAVESLETGYMPDAPRLAGFTYRGAARPAS